jgi:hypothetical protein
MTKLLQLEVTLESDTPEAHRIVVPPSTRLPKLHHAIADAMGWKGEGGHLFHHEGRLFGYQDREGDLFVEDERTIRVDDLLLEPDDEVTYEYCGEGRPPVSVRLEAYVMRG